jgi:hypothetical protein
LDPEEITIIYRDPKQGLNFYEGELSDVLLFNIHAKAEL